MKTNGKSAKYKTIFVVCLLFVLTTCFFAYWMYIRPVHVFLIQERKSEPLFDALNETAYEQLPPAPAGVELTGQSATGISILHNIHGRLLRLRYSINGSNLNSDTILRYYDEKMLQKGWKNIPSKYHMNDSVAVAYQQNTGCIRIIMYKKFYTIEIWHDYISQTFSPEIPPTGLMNLLDGYKTEILQCP